MTSVIHRKWSKHKKLFFSAPERARTVLNAFLDCMYFDKMTDGRTDGRTNGRLFPIIPVLFIISGFIYGNSVNNGNSVITEQFR